MNPEALAQEIATLVVRDINFWIAVVGALGVILGAAVTILGNLLIHRLKSRPAQQIDSQRKSILREMLRMKKGQDGWRNLATLAAVIGATEEDTKRLLIAIKARGSETGSGWALIEDKPLADIIEK